MSFGSVQLTCWPDSLHFLSQPVSCCLSVVLSCGNSALPLTQVARLVKARRDRP